MPGLPPTDERDSSTPVNSAPTRVREEALRRLRPATELFGRGDMGQWSRYERDGDETARIVFSVWDSGANSIFSGMENTTLFTRHEVEVRLNFLRGITKISLQDWAGADETKSLRRALETAPKEAP